MYISDEAVLQMERTRAKLEQKLRDRGVYVEDGEDLNSLVDKLDKIGSNSDNFTALLENSVVAIDDDRPTILKTSMFYNCPNLKSIKLNSVTKLEGTINNSGLYIAGNPILEEIELNCLQTITGSLYNSFSSNKKLKKLSMKNLRNISMNNTFQYLGYEVLDRFKIVLPQLNTIIGSSNFAYIGATLLILPRLTSLNGNTTSFATYCPNLQIVDLGSPNLIPDFRYSNKFDTLILRKETVLPLSTVSIFTQTCFASDGTGGTVYCPSNLIEDYKVATNWSSINVTFLPIEGTIYEDLDWADKEEFMITVDSDDYYLPIDTTVAQYKTTFMVDNLYSDNVELSDDVLLVDYKSMKLTTMVESEVVE